MAIVNVQPTAPPSSMHVSTLSCAKLRGEPNSALSSMQHWCTQNGGGGFGGHGAAGGRGGLANIGGKGWYDFLAQSVQSVSRLHELNSAPGPPSATRIEGRRP